MMSMEQMYQAALRLPEPRLLNILRGQDDSLPQAVAGAALRMKKRAAQLEGAHHACHAAKPAVAQPLEWADEGHHEGGGHPPHEQHQREVREPLVEARRNRLCERLREEHKRDGRDEHERNCADDDGVIHEAVAACCPQARGEQLESGRQHERHRRSDRFHRGHVFRRGRLHRRHAPLGGDSLYTKRTFCLTIRMTPVVYDDGRSETCVHTDTVQVVSKLRQPTEL